MILAALAGLVILLTVYVAVFRGEGLAALYVMGIPLVFLLVGLLGIPWNVYLTGAFYPVVFVGAGLWWLFDKPKPDEPQLPRRFSPQFAGILLLFVVWEPKYFVEVRYYGVQERYEYYKWAYAIARWAMPFVLGALFPLTPPRLHRFVRALCTLGALMGLIIMFGYVTGIRDYSQWQTKFSPEERDAVGLNIGINCAYGCAAAMAYLFILNTSKEKVLWKNIFVSLLIGVMVLAILLSGKRGPLAVVCVAGVLTLLLVGTRGTIRLGLGLGVLGLLLYFTISLVPEHAMARIFGGGSRDAGFGGGIQTRIDLIIQSFRILDVAPLLGQSTGLTSIIGMAYPHNMTLQFMVELGVVGLLVFLLSVLTTLVVWVGASIRRNLGVWTVTSPLLIVFSSMFMERHSGGSMLSADIWVLLGLLMGHSLSKHAMDVYRFKANESVYSEANESLLQENPGSGRVYFQ